MMSTTRTLSISSPRRVGAFRVMASVALISLMASTTPAVGERVENPILGTARITSPEGFERVLLSFTLPRDFDRVSLGDISLRIPRRDLAIPRTLDVFVGAISTPWSPGAVDWTTGWRTPGGDIDPGLRSRVTIEREASGDSFIDLSSIARAGANDVATYGILLSVPEGRGLGFDPETAIALESALSHAQIEIHARAVPGERTLFNKDGYVPPDED